MKIIQLIQLIYLTIVELVKQAWLFPKSITAALEQKRRRADRVVREAERLDRLRHPSKYQGK